MDIRNLTQEDINKLADGFLEVRTMLQGILFEMADAMDVLSDFPEGFEKESLQINISQTASLAEEALYSLGLDF